MKILLIGNGGREHAIAWRLRRSPSVSKIVCPNGNPGIAREADVPRVDLPSIDATADYAARERFDLVVVGPEAPLAAGLADACEARGLKVFGPSRAAAQIEASKAFSKDVMRAAGIPTAAYETFDDYDKALDFALGLGLPVVVKADGLAAGKGVSVCTTKDELVQALRENLKDARFGNASARVVVEQFLHGEEASILAFCDGRDVYPLVPAQDHKRVFDNDEGPNTGGMGTYAPAPVATEEVVSAAYGEVLLPAVREMARRGTPYKGILYAGLMVGEDGINTIEFNCRFGDPETQVILPLLDGDLGEIMLACCEGRLAGASIGTRPGHAACVVLASGGYPGDYAVGKPIRGLDTADGPDRIVFHAGTKAGPDGSVLTAGGRVLGLTAWAPTLQSAVNAAYRMAETVTFEGAHFRRDIARRALDRGTAR